MQNKQEEVDAQESLHKIVTAEGNVLADYSKLLPDLRSRVMEHIGEFEMELETRYYHYYCYWIVCQIFFIKNLPFVILNVLLVITCKDCVIYK